MQVTIQVTISILLDRLTDFVTAVQLMHDVVPLTRCPFLAYPVNVLEVSQLDHQVPREVKVRTLAVQLLRQRLNRLLNLLYTNPTINRYLNLEDGMERTLIPPSNSNHLFLRPCFIQFFSHFHNSHQQFRIRHRISLFNLNIRELELSKRSHQHLSPPLSSLPYRASRSKARSEDDGIETYEILPPRPRSLQAPERLIHPPTPFPRPSLHLSFPEV